MFPLDSTGVEGHIEPLEKRAFVLRNLCQSIICGFCVPSDLAISHHQPEGASVAGIAQALIEATAEAAVASKLADHGGRGLNSNSVFLPHSFVAETVCVYIVCPNCYAEL